MNGIIIVIAVKQVGSLKLTDADKREIQFFMQVDWCLLNNLTYLQIQVQASNPHKGQGAIIWLQNNILN